MSTAWPYCPHCQQPLPTAAEDDAIRYCVACGHRADVVRADCDCGGCVETERLRAIRAREQERKRSANERRRAG
jgi:hypothetical protein